MSLKASTGKVPELKLILVEGAEAVVDFIELRADLPETIEEDKKCFRSVQGERRPFSFAVGVELFVDFKKGRADVDMIFNMLPQR